MRERGAALCLAALLATALPVEGQESSTPGAARGVEVWGDAYYQAATTDSADPSSGTLAVAQEAGLSLNLRSPQGLEVLADFVVPLEMDAEVSPETLFAQLYIRASPASGVSISAGRQRLNWGTAKIFAPIDLLESRANPLDLRPLLPGVSGLKVDFFPDERFAVSLVVLPASDLRWSRAAARVELLLEGIGLDLGFGAVKYGDPDLSDRIGIMNDGALSFGSVVLYEEAELRWDRESVYIFPGMTGIDDLGGRDAAVFRAAAGVMFPVDLGLTRPMTVIAEYFFNGDGLSADEARTFESRYSGWQAAGCPAGAEVPDGFSALGGMRRHYVAAAFSDIALDRFLLLGITGIFGIDSMLGWLAADLAWEVAQGTTFALRYEIGHAFQPDQPTDLLLIPFRNRVTLSVTTSYK